MRRLLPFAKWCSMADNRKRFRDGGSAIYWAMAILLFPLSWLMAMLIAAGIHEMGHYIAVRWCGRKILRLKPGITGACLETAGLSAGQELLSALAGPLIGLLPILAIRWIPKIAICALAQSLFNLLPIDPLDGGRIVRCATQLLRIPEKWCTVLEYFVLTILALAATYGVLIFRLGIAPVLIVGLLIYKAVVRKRPCKQAKHWI